jgi:cytochrome c
MTGLRFCTRLILRQLLGIGVLTLASLSLASAGGDPERGASLYEECAACHSLEPRLHLTGPSLSKLWGKKAGSVEGFPRYSKALQAQGFIWNELTLDAWIKDPLAFVDGTYMTFAGMKEDASRADLIEFLKLALANEDATSLRAKRMLPEDIVRGQVPDSLHDPSPAQLVVSVRHCRNTFFLVTADGVERPIWETNLRLKVDTGPAGPMGERPILMPSGMQGDKASLIFSDPAQISRVIEKC